MVLRAICVSAFTLNVGGVASEWFSTSPRWW